MWHGLAQRRRLAVAVIQREATDIGFGDQRDLERFIAAQDPMYDEVLAELQSGRKTTHWMWFVFPQIAGLGRSATAVHYAIEDVNEARAYFDHPVLGLRLVECTRAVLASNAPTAEAIFGPVDAVKLRSSMTLFEAAAPEERAFGQVIDRFYGGVRDELTLSILGADRTA